MSYLDAQSQDPLDPSYSMGEQSPLARPVPPSMRAYHQTIADKIAATIAGDERHSGREHLAESLLGTRGSGSTGMGLLDVTGVTAPLQAEEAGREAAAGHYGTAAASALGLVPGVGKLASKGAKALAPKVANALAKEGALFPELAEAYPKTGPGEWKQKTDFKTGELKFDKKTGEPLMYEAKKGTAQEQALLKARGVIQKELDKGGWQPYFPVGERFDAPAAELASPRSTALETRGLPGTKPKTLEAWNAMINDPKVPPRLIEAYQHGKSLGGADRWYQIGQLHAKFREELGHAEGDRQFKEFVHAMAGSTAGQDPENNLMIAQLVRYSHENNIPLPTHPTAVPSPLRAGKYGVVPNIHEGTEMLRAGVTPENPKKFNFAQNFFGKADVATLDEQMGNIMYGRGTAVPFAKSGNNPYGLFEPLINRLAEQMGVSPREFQEVAWAGYKNMTSKGAKKYQPKSFIQTINEAIERTHRLTGMPHEEIVKRGLVRGQIPLYGATGVIGLGAAANQLDQQPAPAAQSSSASNSL